MNRPIRVSISHLVSHRTRRAPCPSVCLFLRLIVRSLRVLGAVATAYFPLILIRLGVLDDYSDVAIFLLLGELLLRLSAVGQRVAALALLQRSIDCRE